MGVAVVGELEKTDGGIFVKMLGIFETGKIGFHVGDRNRFGVTEGIGCGIELGKNGLVVGEVDGDNS